MNKSVALLVFDFPVCQTLLATLLLIRCSLLLGTAEALQCSIQDNTGAYRRTGLLALVGHCDSRCERVGPHCCYCGRHQRDALRQRNFAEQDGCPGSLTINNDDFKIGARGRDDDHNSQFKAQSMRPCCSARCCLKRMCRPFTTARLQLRPPVSADIVGGLPASLVGYWPLDGDATELSSNSGGHSDKRRMGANPYGLAFHLFGRWYPCGRRRRPFGRRQCPHVSCGHQ